jgi:Flp pilus assembly pilin Flp
MHTSRRDRKHKQGQGMVELALILCLVALVALVSLQLVGNQLMLTYQDIQEAIVNAGDPGAQAAYTCPDGTTAVLHGHKFHCH